MKTQQEKVAAYDKLQKQAQVRRVKLALWVEEAKKVLAKNKLTVTVSDDMVNAELARLAAK